MCFLRDEILRAIMLAHRKAGHIGARRAKEDPSSARC